MRLKDNVSAARAPVYAAHATNFHYQPCEYSHLYLYVKRACDNPPTTPREEGASDGGEALASFEFNFSSYLAEMQNIFKRSDFNALEV